MKFIVGTILKSRAPAPKGPRSITSINTPVKANPLGDGSWILHNIRVLRDDPEFKLEYSFIQNSEILQKKFRDSTEADEFISKYAD